MTEEEMKWGGGGDTPGFLGKKEKKNLNLNLELLY